MSPDVPEVQVTGTTCVIGGWVWCSTSRLGVEGYRDCLAALLDDLALRSRSASVRAQTASARELTRLVGPLQETWRTLAQMSRDVVPVARATCVCLPDGSCDEVPDPLDGTAAWSDPGLPRFAPCSWGW